MPTAVPGSSVERMTMLRGREASDAIWRTAARTMSPFHSSSASSVPTQTMTMSRAAGSLEVDGEPQAPAAEALGHELVEPGFVDRQVALVQARDAGLIDVETDDLVAQVCQAGSGDESDVAGSDDGEMHRQSVAEPSPGPNVVVRAGTTGGCPFCWRALPCP